MIFLISSIVGVGIILLLLTPCYIYLSSRPKYKILTLLVKGLTTSIAFFFALYGYLKLNSIKSTSVPDTFFQNYWLLIAIGVCLIGDIVLRIHRVIGGIIFFVGHVAYIIFFLKLGEFHSISILIFTILCISGLCYFYRYLPRMEGLEIPLALYGCVISASVSLGVLLPLSVGIYGFIPAIAISLLFISDILLAHNKVIEESVLTRSFALLYYFGGQFLMAMTFYLPAVL